MNRGNSATPYRPPPDRYRFVPKRNAIKDRDQGRVHLNVSDAMRQKRVFGFIGSIRTWAQSSGTFTPAPVQAVANVRFWKRRALRWGRGFFRTAAFSAAYALKRADGALLWSVLWRVASLLLDNHWRWMLPGRYSSP